MTGAIKRKGRPGRRPDARSVIPTGASSSILAITPPSPSQQKTSTKHPSEKGLRRKDGNWEYRFKWQGMPYRGSTGLAATPENVLEAQQLRREHRERVKRGEVTLSARKVSFFEAIEQFLTWYAGEHPNGNPKWSRSMLNSFLFFFTTMQPCLLSQLGQAHMEAFKTWRRSIDIKDNSLRKQLILLRQFFNYARKHGWMSRDPLADVKIPAEQGSDAMHVLSPAEEREYFKAASELSPDLYDVGRIMLEQGCRPDEVMSLEQVNIDLTERRFKVWNSTTEGKSENAHRALLMTQGTHNILTRRLCLPGKWVFPSSKINGPRTTLQKKHESAVERSGVVCRLYDMRHTFATRFAVREGGAGSLPALAKILGHADLSLLMRYVHPSQEDMDRAMQHFDQAQRRARKRMKAEEQKERMLVTVQ